MQPIYIVFGTESGNAQGLADRAKEALEKAGLACRVVDMLDVAQDGLTELETLLVITSTYGNGDPPSNAEAIHAFLMKKCGPRPNMRFSVCGLGDTTYERFAQCGKDFDRRLGELGATRLVDRQDCDVDYEVPFEAWLGKVVHALTALIGASTARPEGELAPHVVSQRADLPGTRRNPVSARVLENRNLNGPGSTKETRHFVLSTEGLPLAHELGDCIGLWPVNGPELVRAALDATGLGADAEVRYQDQVRPLAELLARRLDLQEPDVRLIDRVLGTTTAEARQAASRDHHVLDLLAASRGAWTADELLHHLRPLAPRLYSVASSPRVHPGEVHLLIDIVRYELGARPRMGVASRFIVDHAPAGSVVDVFVQPAPGFRLCDAARDIVMIGPGTGVAPFRGFLEERARTRGPGRSWLFYGARNRATDHVYEADLQRFLDAGVLTHLDVAFSRDQADKVYVQHRLAEHAEEVAAWIRGGATVYVCGDAKRMAPDVHAALASLLGAGKGGLESGAKELDALAAEGRYVRDVY
ncbi:MAG: flavodoxin domain-containing protein [Polyangiaceae bacterium]|nr:flavodoxin domain-containing protein [Polyangiaceae bacterium]